MKQYIEKKEAQEIINLLGIEKTCVLVGLTTKWISFWDEEDLASHIKLHYDIGKMIEILGENAFMAHNVHCKVEGVLKPYWSVMLCDTDIEVHGTELCDALFEAVKRFLIKE